MTIDTSQVSFETTHRARSATALIDQTVVRHSAVADRPQPEAADTVHLSSLAGSLATGDRDDLQDLTPKQRLAWMAIEALLGRHIKFSRFRPAASAAGAPGPSTGDRVLHTHVALHSESEQTSFQARGTVETADGRSIEFAVRLDMNRDFQSAATTTSSGKTADPLIVNFGGSMAQLTGAKVSFDLSSDGNPESISFVSAGSGFLVLDANGDGQVNNGGELFGPQSGSGFAELAAFDRDGNGWIDENDPVFAKLRIWSQDGLATLSQQGIGAISTASAETPFAIKDSGNQLLANVRSSGIYLSESGAAGTIQQVDLAEG